MSWTTPRTWVAGEVVTAAIMNTHVRDNLSFLKNNQVIAGVLTSSGTVSTGAGFSSSRTSAGVYVVTFTTAFASVPAVVATLDNATFALGGVFIDTKSASGFTTHIRDSTNTAQDAQISFVASVS